MKKLAVKHNPFSLSREGKNIEIERCMKNIVFWMSRDDSAETAFNKAQSSYSFHVALAASKYLTI